MPRVTQGHPRLLMPPQGYPWQTESSGLIHRYPEPLKPPRTTQGHKTWSSGSVLRGSWLLVNCSGRAGRAVGGVCRPARWAQASGGCPRGEEGRRPQRGASASTFPPRFTSPSSMLFSASQPSFAALRIGLAWARTLALFVKSLRSAMPPCPLWWGRSQPPRRLPQGVAGFVFHGRKPWEKLCSCSGRFVQVLFLP